MSEIAFRPLEDDCPICKKQFGNCPHSLREALAHIRNREVIQAIQKEPAPRAIPPFTSPANVDGLRPYQVEGVLWLRRRASADPRTLFEAAGFDFESLTLIPAKAAHSSLADVEAYLDVDAHLLMFVDTTGPRIRSFMFYIGEEHNQDVIGVGRGIAAFRISESRATRLLGQLERWREK